MAAVQPYQSVYGHGPILVSNERIHIDFENVRTPGYESRERRNGTGDSYNIQGLLRVVTIEKGCASEAPEHSESGRAVHRGKVDGRVTENFGEYAADAHEDHRPEHGIASNPQDEFSARPGHLLHQERMGNIRKSIVHLPDGRVQRGRISDIQRNSAPFSFVRNEL